MDSRPIHLGGLLALWLTTTLFGQGPTAVRPARLSWTALPGETVETALQLVNRTGRPVTAWVGCVSLGRDDRGHWTIATPSNEPNEEATQSPWDSCLSWLCLGIAPDASGGATLTVPAAQGHQPGTVDLPLRVEIPSAAAGSYLAAVQVRFGAAQAVAGTALAFEFVVPVVVDVLPGGTEVVARLPARAVLDLAVTAMAGGVDAESNTLRTDVCLHNGHPRSALAVRWSLPHVLQDAQGRPVPVRWHGPRPGRGRVPAGGQTNLPLTAEVLHDIERPVTARLTLRITGSPKDGRPTYYLTLPISMGTGGSSATTPVSRVRLIQPQPFDPLAGGPPQRWQGVLALYGGGPWRLTDPRPADPWHWDIRAERNGPTQLTVLTLEGPATGREAGLPPAALVVGATP